MEPTTLTAPQLEKVLNDFKAEMQEFVTKSLANFQTWMQKEPSLKTSEETSLATNADLPTASQMAAYAKQWPSESVTNLTRNILSDFKRSYASKGLTSMTYRYHSLCDEADNIRLVVQPTVRYLKELGYSATFIDFRDGTCFIDISCK